MIHPMRPAQRRELMRVLSDAFITRRPGFGREIQPRETLFHVGSVTRPYKNMIGPEIFQRPINRIFHDRFNHRRRPGQLHRPLIAG
jgi:hypothetical protein